MSKKDVLFNQSRLKVIRSDICPQALEVFETDTHRVVLDGVIYNKTEIINRFKLNKEYLFTEIIIKFEKIGMLEALLKVIDGVFCLYILNKNSQEFKFVTDRHGLHMIYYSCHRNALYVSNRVKNILSCSDNHAIDQDALNCFMHLGYLMGEQTYFKNIKLSKPASIFTYNLVSGILTQRYYWTWREVKPSNLSFDEAVDFIGELFLNSVRKRFELDKSMGIALSGGLDSRAILAAVNKIEPHFEGYCYTFGAKGSLDSTIAKAVAQTAGWRHEVFELSSENWFPLRLPCVISTDGMLDFKHMHGVEFGEKIQSQINVNLNGYLGDVVAGGGWMNEKHLNERASDLNLQDFYHQFSAFGYHSDPYFDICNREPALYVSRARRFTNMGVSAGALFVEQRMPFFDNEFLEGLLSLPDKFRLHNKLYSTMLKKFFPEFFMSFPWQKTGKIVDIYNKTKRTNIFVRLNRKLTRIVSGTRYAYTDYPTWVKSPMFWEWVQQNINREGQLLQDNFEWRALEDTLLLHKSGSKDFSNEILRLLTLQLYFSDIETEGFSFS